MAPTCHSVEPHIPVQNRYQNGSLRESASPVNMPVHVWQSPGRELFDRMDWAPNGRDCPSSRHSQQVNPDLWCCVPHRGFPLRNLKRFPEPVPCVLQQAPRESHCAEEICDKPLDVNLDFLCFRRSMNSNMAYMTDWWRECVNAGHIYIHAWRSWSLWD